MANRIHIIVLTCLMAGLFACAPTAPPTDSLEDTAVRGADRVILDTRALTGVEVQSEPLWQIIYPFPVLYQPGAVLPSPEGLDHLETLATWLKRYPQQQWQVTVNAHAVEDGAEASSLSAKRQKLLARFFERKGLDQSRWEWQTASEEDFQLRFSGAETP